MQELALYWIDLEYQFRANFFDIFLNPLDWINKENKEDK